MTAILKVDTIQDTAGNNIINESSDTITIGASGDTITIPAGATITNSGTASGFGKVLQVVSDTLTSEYTTGSASFNDTGLTLNITPSATSSKILLMMSGTAYVNTSGNSIIFTFLRGSTNLATGDSSGAYGFARLQSNAGNLVAVQSPMHIDSPSSTSQLTYKVQGRLETASGAGQLSINSTTSTLIAMEIGA